MKVNTIGLIAAWITFYISIVICVIMLISIAVANPKIDEMTAKPNINGGYELYIYKGILIEWVYLGSVSREEDVKQAFENMKRTTINSNN